MDAKTEEFLQSLANKPCPEGVTFIDWRTQQCQTIGEYVIGQYVKDWLAESIRMRD